MKKFALAAAAAALVAGPALADEANRSFAIMHFNMDEDSADEMRMVPEGNPIIVDLGADTSLAELFAQFNMQEDMFDAQRGQGANGVTIIMSDPGAAADVFAMIRAESAEDE
ncbi:MAG: hypothetical protein AAF376_09350 [Pseudomonadota bacterium]